MTLRRVGGALAVLVLVAGLLGYWQWYRPTRYAVGIGTGMLAKQMCSCIFVAGRDEGACRADQMPSMDPIQLEVRDDPKSVFAFIPLLGERLAIYRDGLGCTLQ
jgi:hypothetical protein